jgi:hypothetical protein
MEQIMTKMPKTTQATSTRNPEPATGANDQPVSSPFDLNKAAVFTALTAAGITQIIVSFDGYGDSGQIEDISAKSGDESLPVPEGEIEILDAAWPQSELRQSSVSLHTAVENLAYDVLAQTHCGWENNDGAYGDIIFDAAARTITLDYNERYTESENFTHIL